MPGIGEKHMCDTICRLETPVNGHVVIEENLRSLTAEELLDYALKICLENQELHASAYSAGQRPVLRSKTVAMRSERSPLILR